MECPLVAGAASSVHLLGGGWDAVVEMYGPFLDAAGTQAAIACVVLDEGDGAQEFLRWDAVLRRTAACRPVPVLVRLGDRLDVRALGEAQAVLVCGGLTPAYADALVPVASELRAWLSVGRPYAGFSAGAALAARHAVVGGWRHGGQPVCPEEAGEDLDEVTVRPGLGLVDVTVDVHCSQWGTLPRLRAALSMAAGAAGLAIDEDTAVHCYPERTTVTGRGQVRPVPAT